METVLNIGDIVVINNHRFVLVELRGPNNPVGKNVYLQPVEHVKPCILSDFSDGDHAWCTEHDLPAEHLRNDILVCERYAKIHGCHCCRVDISKKG